MMRMVRAIAVATLLVGCAPMTKQPAATSGPKGCDAGKLHDLIGKPYDGSEADALRNKAGARLIRVIRPGNMVTMDFREDRLNVKLDASDRVTGLNCG